MRLEDYFNDKKQSTVSETQKFAMYEKIITQRAKSRYSKRFSQKRSLLHTKSFIYGLTLTVLFVALYGTFFMQNNTWKSENGISIQTPNIKSVQADYIANIVNFDGDFFIEHKGIRIQTSNISNGDTVILDGETELVFQMDKTTQARIIWPAKFILEKDKDRYTLNIIHWDFVEIQSLQKENTQEIEVLADDFIVYQDKSSKAVKFQLINKGGKHIVANKWESKVTVSKNNKKTEINKAELATIEDNDITLLTVTEFNTAIKNKDISQTFFRQTNQKKKEETNNKSRNQEKTIITEHELTGLQITGILATSWVVDTQIAKDLGIVDEGKEILSIEDNNKLYSLLQKEFLINNLQNLFTYASLWSDKEFNIAYENLEHRIEQVYKIFDTNYSLSKGDFNQLQTNITKIHDQIKDKYLIPPKYLNNLLELNKGIKLIVSNDFTSSGENRESIANQLMFQ